MSLRFACPDCGAVNTWPDHAVARLLRCPGCRGRFTATEPLPDDEPSAGEPDEPLAAVAVDAADEEPAEDEPAEVEPADDEDDAATELALADEVQATRDGDGLAEMTSHQRTVYALLHHTFDNSTFYLVKTAVGLVLVPVCLVVAGGAGFLLMLVVGWLAGLGVAVAGAWVGYLVYILPAALAFLCWGIAKMAWDHPVSLVRDGDRAAGFKLGRLNTAVDIAEPVTLTVFFGALVGLQITLIYNCPDHGGLGAEARPGLGEAALLVLDNACHGIFLDTFELYGIHAGPRVEHTTWSATVFFFFRLGYEGLVLLFFYSLYQRWSLRRLFWTFPPVHAGPYALTAWVEQVCAEDGRLPRKFFDEFLFLGLAAAYVRGDFGLVRQMSQLFPRLHVTEEVRALFRDTGGERIFFGQAP